MTEARGRAFCEGSDDRENEYESGEMSSIVYAEKMHMEAERMRLLIIRVQALLYELTVWMFGSASTELELACGEDERTLTWRGVQAAAVVLMASRTANMVNLLRYLAKAAFAAGTDCSESALTNWCPDYS